MKIDYSKYVAIIAGYWIGGFIVSSITNNSFNANLALSLSLGAIGVLLIDIMNKLKRLNQ